MYSTQLQFSSQSTTVAVSLFLMVLPATTVISSFQHYGIVLSVLHSINVDHSLTFLLSSFDHSPTTTH